MISYEEAIEIFEYKDGILYWKKSPKKTKIGTPVGCKTHNGYLITHVNYQRYRVHHIVYLMHHKKFPSLIDHINGIRGDNRIENLREATINQNNQNRRATAHSGIKGVYWHKQINRWVASICINKKNIHLGSFLNKDDAAHVAINARKKIHGDFARGEQA
jgi:hypothetical protein